VVLIGSEAGEIAMGIPEVERFFTRLFARTSTFSCEERSVAGAMAGDTAWFFADGFIVMKEVGARKSAPYRVSGVLERADGRWRWKLYHGSEPVPAPA